MERDDFIHIQAPMVTELGLSGNRLVVYALIHGFCKDGLHEFRGSINYICDWTGITRNTAISVLKSLVDDNLLIKREYTENNVKFCAYNLGSVKIAPVVQSGAKEVVQKLHYGSAEIAPNNNNITNNVNKKEDKSSLKKDDNFDYDALMDYYNKHVVGEMPRIQRMSKQRKQNIHARLKEYDEESLYIVIDKCCKSSFLTGSSGWHATFDWLFLPTNFLKVLEGNYDDKNQKDLFSQMPSDNDDMVINGQVYR